jgi:hypothetical protein
MDKEGSDQSSGQLAERTLVKEKTLKKSKFARFRTLVELLPDQVGIPDLEAH